MSSSQKSGRALVLSASFWTVGGYGIAMMIRLAGNVVLARLLFPEAFGLMALVAVLLHGLHLFSDFGLQPSIIQNQKGDQIRFLNTAWTIQAVRGLVLWIVACAVAVPFAFAYGEPLLAWLIPITAVSAIVTGLNSTALITENKRLRLGRITTLEILTQALSVTLMIIIAVFYRSVWALVFGALAASVVKLLLSHFWIATTRNHWCFDERIFWEIFSFGKWIFVSTLLTFLTGQGDKLVFGQLVPIDLLGIYAIAAALAMLPADVISRLSGSVIFPAYCRTLSNGGDFPTAFNALRVPLLSIGVVLITTLLIAAPKLIALLYDDRYSDASWILQLLLIGTVFRILECANGSALLAHGNGRMVAAGSGAMALVMVLTILIGYKLFEFPGAVLGYAASESARYAVSVVVTSRYVPGAFLFDLYLLTNWIAITGVGYMFRNWLVSSGVELSVSTAYSLLSVMALWTVALWKPASRWFAHAYGSPSKPKRRP